MRQSMMTVIFLVLLLTLGTATVDGKECKARCQPCSGICSSNKACTASCQQWDSSFTRGQCQSFPPKCYCVKPCLDFITMYLDQDDSK